MFFVLFLWCVSSAFGMQTAPCLVHKSTSGSFFEHFTQALIDERYGYAKDLWRLSSVPVSLRGQIGGVVYRELCKRYLYEQKPASIDEAFATLRECGIWFLQDDAEKGAFLCALSECVNEVVLESSVLKPSAQQRALRAIELVEKVQPQVQGVPLSASLFSSFSFKNSTGHSRKVFPLSIAFGETLQAEDGDALGAAIQTSEWLLYLLARSVCHDQEVHFCPYYCLPYRLSLPAEKVSPTKIVVTSIELFAKKLTRLSRVLSENFNEPDVAVKSLKKDIANACAEVLPVLLQSLPKIKKQ